MRVLVTGGLGVIGSCIARRLVEAGHKVTIIDAAEAERNRWIRSRLPDDVRVIPNRLETFPKDLLADRVGEVDAVIHAAASTGIPHSVLNPDDDWHSNVDATRALLEALRKHPVPTIVISSIKPYLVPSEADLMRTGGLTELAPLVPDEPYAASKASQSMLAMAYARSYELPVVTFRCSNLYGPAPCHGPRHGWLTWFAISAAIGRPIEVQGTGTQSRDMLHADDVYAACMTALSQARSLAGRVFNLGGGATNRITVFDAALCMRAASGVELIAGPTRAMDDDHVFVNTARFLKATGWRPQVSVDEGARQVLNWAVENKAELAELYDGV